MSILICRDLEFLASLKAHWRRYYLNEVARLLKEDGNRCDNLPEAPFIDPQSRCERGFNRPSGPSSGKQKPMPRKKPNGRSTNLAQPDQTMQFWQISTQQHSEQKCFYGG